jgi:hypothetical protein
MKHAVYTGSRNLYGDMQTACKSLIANSDVDKVWLLVEDDDYDFYVPDIVEVVDVSDQEFFPEGSPNMSTRFSYLALMRAALALMPEFSDLDRIFSLDVDTLAVRDCSDVWDLPVEDCYFSASKEVTTKFRNMLYCNTGVALYNLEKLRDGKAEEVIHALNTRQFPYVEQDVFNFLCQGHIHDMPSDYNSNAFVATPAVERVKHYAGYKTERWREFDLVQHWRNVSWDDAMMEHDRKKSGAKHA